MNLITKVKVMTRCLDCWDDFSYASKECPTCNGTRETETWIVWGDFVAELNLKQDEM